VFVQLIVFIDINGMKQSKRLIKKFDALIHPMWGRINQITSVAQDRRVTDAAIILLNAEILVLENRQGAKEQALGKLLIDDCRSYIKMRLPTIAKRLITPNGKPPKYLLLPGTRAIVAFLRTSKEKGAAEALEILLASEAQYIKPAAQTPIVGSGNVGDGGQ
jgi:hypothetical protein